MQTVRGTHSCYVCGRPLTWVGCLDPDELVVMHGQEVSAKVSASGRTENGQVELSAELQCPYCEAVNLFKSAIGPY